MNARLVPIPSIPPSADAEVQAVLAALKQNVEVLAGFTGDKESRALLYGALNVGELDQQQSAAAAANPPTKTEFDLVVTDLTTLRDRVNYLLARLRGDPTGT